MDTQSNPINGETQEPAAEAVSGNHRAVEAAEQILAEARETKPMLETPLEHAKRVIEAAKRQLLTSLLNDGEKNGFQEQIAYAERAFCNHEFDEAIKLARQANDDAWKLKGERRIELERINKRADELVAQYADLGLNVDRGQVFFCLRYGGETAAMLYLEHGFDARQAIFHARQETSSNQRGNCHPGGRTNRDAEWRDRKLRTSQAGPAKGPGGGGRR